jgi:hypothetical protein
MISLHALYTPKLPIGISTLVYDVRSDDDDEDDDLSCREDGECDLRSPRLALR